MYTSNVYVCQLQCIWHEIIFFCFLLLNTHSKQLEALKVLEISFEIHAYSLRCVPIIARPNCHVIALCNVIQCTKSHWYQLNWTFKRVGAKWIAWIADNCFFRFSATNITTNNSLGGSRSSWQRNTVWRHEQLVCGKLDSRPRDTFDAKLAGILNIKTSFLKNFSALLNIEVTFNRYSSTKNSRNFFVLYAL